MAPNPRVIAAFRAMKDLGIPESKVKRVLKRLLKLYDKNWELIEEENYRALADAIFDEDETKASEQKKKPMNTDEEGLEEEAQEHEESERPLKRLRLRGQEGLASSSLNNCNARLDGSLKRPKVEEDELPASFSSQPSQGMSGSLQPAFENGAPSPFSSQVALKEKRSTADRASHAARSKAPDIHAMIKPKDEPFTDGMPNIEVLIAVIHPGQTSKGDSSGGNVIPVGHLLGVESSVSEFADEGNRGGDDLDVPSDTRINFELETVAEESPCRMDIAFSSMVEEMPVNILPAFDVSEIPAIQDALNIGDDMETICTPIMSNDSLNISFPVMAAQQIPALLPTLNSLDDNEQGINKTIVNGCADIIEGNLPSSGVIPHCELATNTLRSLHDMNDITRGEEKVNIPWVNEINKEYPPSFQYMPKSFAFRTASVNLNLRQMKDENCCPTCIGDCLESSTACVCANDTGGKYVYTPDGLIKEYFLEECVDVNHKPRKDHYFYCKECPVEKSKKDDVLEPCKGHLRRKFIKECWRKCGCNVRQCGNRVVQRGINCKLQVFMTPDGKGWGLRTLDELPKGAFVCEYVGEILTNVELYKRNMQNSKKRSYPVLLDAGWGSGVVEDEKALCLDSTSFGNVARFINHRCLDANLVEIPVEVETPDHSYYHVAFFTTRKVDALEELTRDYGIDFDDEDHPAKPFRCGCGSKFCRNMKRSNRSSSGVAASKYFGAHVKEL